AAARHRSRIGLATSEPHFHGRSARRGRQREGAGAAPRSHRAGASGRCASDRAQLALMPPRFEPAAWLPHAHLQTIYAAIFAPAPRPRLRRERWETPDGDFVDVDFVDGPEHAPWLNLFHGLEGSSRSPYARTMMSHVERHGWRGSVFHFRGCSGEPNRLP